MSKTLKLMLQSTSTTQRVVAIPFVEEYDTVQDSVQEIEMEESEEVEMEESEEVEMEESEEVEMDESQEVSEQEADQDAEEEEPNVDILFSEGLSETQTSWNVEQPAHTGPHAWFIEQPLPKDAKLFEPIHLKLTEKFQFLEKSEKDCKRFVSAIKGFESENGRRREHLWKKYDEEANIRAFQLDTRQQQLQKERMGPEDSRRWLKNETNQLFDMHKMIHSKKLETQIGEYSLEATMTFLDVREVVGTWLNSSVLASHGPFHYEPLSCPSLKQFGRDVRESRKEYLKQFPLTGDDLVIELGCYTDGSSNMKQESFYAMYLFPVQYDTYARSQSIDDSITVVSFLPTEKLISVRNSNGPCHISQLPDNIRNQALSEFKKSSIGTYVEHVADVSASHFFMKVHNRIRMIRLISHCHICDIQERFMILGLLVNHLKVCSFCYADISKLNDGQVRSVEEDDEYSDLEDVFLHHNAISACPYGGSIFLRENNYYSLFPSDILHVTEGVVNDVVAAFQTLYGVRFIEFSKQVGNHVFGSAFKSYHVNEDKNEAFQSIVLAMILFSTKNYTNPNLTHVELNEMKVFAKLSVNLLQLMYYVKCDNAGDCLNDMYECVAEVKQGYRLIATRVKNMATTKSHELIFHWIDHLHRFGNLKNYSTALFETRHQSTWHVFHKADRDLRRFQKNSLIDSRVLIAFDDVYSNNTSSLLDQFDAVPRILLSKQLRNSNFISLFRKNFENIIQSTWNARSLFASEVEMADRELTQCSAVYNSVTYGIFCRKRNFPIKTPRTLKIQKPCFNEIPVMSFNSGKVKLDLELKCRNPFCIPCKDFDLFPRIRKV